MVIVDAKLEFIFYARCAQSGLGVREKAEQKMRIDILISDWNFRARYHG